MSKRNKAQAKTLSNLHFEDIDNIEAVKSVASTEAEQVLDWHEQTIKDMQADKNVDTITTPLNETKDKKKAIPTLTEEQETSLKNQTTTSGKIRYLDSIKMERGDIARLLTIHLNRQDRPMRYQHVRNVLETELKRPQK